MIIGLIIVLSVILSVSKTFVPNNKIIDPYVLEEVKMNELISCQSDCTMGDNVFHEECLNYNGCENTPYLKDKVYCENDYDCLPDLSCCAEECEGSECVDIKYCAVSNKKYIQAHSFSCKRNILCDDHVKCKGSFKTACVFNTCKIIS